jgi:hypothetical protein
LDSGAAALAWWRLRGSALAHAPAASQLRTAYRVQALRAAEQQAHIGPLIDKFRARGIEPILMKGWSLARLYPQLGLRPYGDFDLIVSPEGLPSANSLLAGIHDVGVDLEHEEITRFDRRPFSEIYSRSRLATVGDVQVRVLGEEDQLRALCIHFLKHGGWGPLWLCDIALLVESRSAGFDWELCLGQRRHLRSWVTAALLLAHLLLGMELEGVPLHSQRRQLPRWLVATVLEQWASPPLAYRSTFRSCLSQPRRLAEAIADRWPPNPIVSTLLRGARFGAFPRCVLQAAELASRLAKCLLPGTGREPAIKTDAA